MRFKSFWENGYKIDFNFKKEDVFLNNLVRYKKLMEYDKSIFKKKNNFNKEFFTEFFDHDNVITLLIKGKRGSKKSKLCRNFGFLLQKEDKTFNFGVENIVFDDFTLYQKIKKFIQLNNDYNTLIVRDENPQEIGLSSNTNLIRLQKIKELIRIEGINIVLATPSNNDLNFYEIEYDYLITPFAYKKVIKNGVEENLFFCLFKENDDEGYLGNLIIPDYDIFNSKFYLKYEQNKIQYLNTVSNEESESNINYFELILKLHKKYKILNKNYKISNKEIKLNLLVKNDFILYVQKLRFVLNIKENDLLFSQYKLIMNDGNEYEGFKKYCKKQNYNLQISSNLKEIELKFKKINKKKV